MVLDDPPSPVLPQRPAVLCWRTDAIPFVRADQFDPPPPQTLRNGSPQQNQGFVDLVQGAVAYEAFVKTLATSRKTVGDAKDAANKAVETLYPTLDYSGSPSGKLPQVIYMVTGNPNACPTGTCK